MGVQRMPPRRSSIRLDPAKSFHRGAPSTCHPHIIPALWKLVAARAQRAPLFSGNFLTCKCSHLQMGWECQCWAEWRHHFSLTTFQVHPVCRTPMEKLSPYNSLVLPWSKQKGCWGNIPSERCFLSWGVNGKGKWFMVILDPHWNDTKWIWKMDDGSFLFSETLLTKTMANMFIVQQVWRL